MDPRNQIATEFEVAALELERQQLTAEFQRSITPTMKCHEDVRTPLPDWGTSQRQAQQAIAFSNNFLRCLASPLIEQGCSAILDIKMTTQL